MVIKGVFSPQKAAFSCVIWIVRGIIRKEIDTPTDTPTNTPTPKNKQKVQGSAIAALHLSASFLAVI